MTTEVNISQAYQLMIGRVVSIEDRQELMDQKLDDLMGNIWDELHSALDRVDEEKKHRGTLEQRFDDLWDTVTAFFEKVEHRLPDESKRVAYSHDGDHRVR